MYDQFSEYAKPQAMKSVADEMKRSAVNQESYAPDTLGYLQQAKTTQPAPTTMADKMQDAANENHRRGAKCERGADFLRRHPEFEEFLKLKDEGIL